MCIASLPSSLRSLRSTLLGMLRKDASQCVWVAVATGQVISVRGWGCRPPCYEGGRGGPDVRGRCVAFAACIGREGCAFWEGMVKLETGLARPGEELIGSAGWVVKGGPGGTRTRDLLNAIEARSQLRHRPTYF